jgi:hypothetical protein
LCTLTVLREDTRLLLTMNRDDAAIRPEAAPSIRRLHGTLVATPTDLQAGGAWIGVNEYGVAACLLNRYDSARAGRISRGWIVLEALRAPRAEQAGERIKALAHSEYSPFTCVIVSTAAAAVRFDWNGAQLAQGAIDVAGPWMATSSSWRLDEVRRLREELFSSSWANARRPTGPLSIFHCSRDPARDAWAPMMLRQTAQTKSVTQIELTDEDVKVRYWRRQSAIAHGLDSADKTVRLQLARANLPASTRACDDSARADFNV